MLLSTSFSSMGLFLPHQQSAVISFLFVPMIGTLELPAQLCHIGILMLLFLSGFWNIIHLKAGGLIIGPVMCCLLSKLFVPRKPRPLSCERHSFGHLLHRHGCFTPWFSFLSCISNFSPGVFSGAKVLAAATCCIDWAPVGLWHWHLSYPVCVSSLALGLLGCTYSFEWSSFLNLSLHH